MDNEIKGKKVIYSWRVIAMLNYLKGMLCDKDVERDDFRKVIDNYITFTEETVDARIIQLSADNYSNPQVQND